MTTLELKISGMSCGHCVRAVSDALVGVEGVTIDNVAIGSATVRHDAARVPVGRIIDAVSDAGYEAEEHTG